MSSTYVAVSHSLTEYGMFHRALSQSGRRRDSGEKKRDYISLKHGFLFLNMQIVIRLEIPRMTRGSNLRVMKLSKKDSLRHQDCLPVWLGCSASYNSVSFFLRKIRNTSRGILSCHLEKMLESFTSCRQRHSRTKHVKKSAKKRASHDSCVTILCSFETRSWHYFYFLTPPANERENWWIGRN